VVVDGLKQAFDQVVAGSIPARHTIARQSVAFDLAAAKTVDNCLEVL